MQRELAVVVIALVAVASPVGAAEPGAGKEAVHQREAARSPAAGAGISGALRLVLRSQARRDRRPAAGEASPSGDSGARDALRERLVVDPSVDGRTTRFRAILSDAGPSGVDGLKAAGARLRGRVGRAVSFEGPLRDARIYASAPGVQWLDLSPRLEPEMDISGPETRSDDVRDPNAYGGSGAGVLVATIDTGHDVKHRDLRNADGTTRFVALWNMDPGCNGSPPPGHSTGCYFTPDRINKHLKGKAGLDYKDPKITGGHGTHVIATAAGNGLDTRKGFPAGVFTGMAPDAGLIGVKVYDDGGDFVGDIIEALEFLGEEQARQGDVPLVVNISLGHQFGAHDGSDPDEVAIDAFVDEGLSGGPARIVVKSAGNEGGSGIYVTDPFSTTVHPVTVPLTIDGVNGCGSFLGAGNDFYIAMLWYPGDTTVRVSVTTIDDQFTFSRDTGNDPADPNDVYDDTVYGSILIDCPADVDPVNGDRLCWVGVDDTAGFAPATGTWKIAVEKLSGPPGGKYDAWMVFGQKGLCTVSWDAPSPGGTISLPGTARNAIVVGAYTTRASWTNFKGKAIAYNPVPAISDIASFSSEGPTRDGRTKPDLTAPGMGIASARARNVSIGPGTEARLRTMPDKKHMVLEGTSMAAPHVAGAAAQILSLDPALDADQVRMLLVDNAFTDSFTGMALPDNLWGHGKLDVFAAVEAHLGPP